MGAKKFSHTHRSTVCGLKKLASGVFPESWKVLAEQRRRRKWTKNNKSPGYPGWLNERENLAIQQPFKTSIMIPIIYLCGAKPLVEPTYCQ